MSITPDKLDKLLPKLADAKLEAELHRVIRRIYEYIDLSLNIFRQTIETKIKTGELTPEELAGLIGIFGQPLTGSNISDPLIQTVLQNFGPQTATHFFAGPTPSFRAIELADLPAIPVDAETVRDIIGATLTDSATIDFTYDDAANTITAIVIQAALNIAQSQVTNLVADLAAIVAAIAGKQNLDSTLTALAGYNTNGLITQTAADTFTGRSIAAHADGNLSITDGNGVTGNPTLNTIQGIKTTSTPQFARLGIGVVAPTGDKFIQVTDNTTTNTTEISVTNAAASGNISGAVFRATADVAQIQFAVWASSRTTSRFGVTIGGWSELIAIAGNGAIFGTFNNAPVIFGVNALARGRIDTAGNLKWAGTATRATTEGTNHIDMFSGTAPVGTLANGISLYNTAGELRVMDSGGTATLLSQHSEDAPDWFYDDEITPPNVSMETNCFSGMVRFINFTRQARLQQRLLLSEQVPLAKEKLTFIHEETFEDYNKRLDLKLGDEKYLIIVDWNENQDFMVKQQDEAILNWEELKRLSTKEHNDWRDKKNSFVATEETPTFNEPEPMEFREPKPQKHIKQQKPKWLKDKK